MAGDMEAKLDKLSSEVTVLPLIMSNISELIASFQSFQNMFTTLDNRINHVKASHQDIIDTVEASLHTRISTMEASFESRLRNVEFHQDNSVDNMDPSLSEERNSLKNDVMELSTLMDIHCKDNWEFEEAVRLFPTVTRYGMKNMAAKVSNSLKNKLTVSNCIQIFQLASQHEMDDLWEASKEWISENFVLVSQSALDFCKLTVDEMCVFVYSDTLCDKQEDVFNAINKWVKHDKTHRIVSCLVLLNAVQFHQCTASFLHNIVDHYLVSVNPDVQYAVEEVIKQMIEGQDNFCPSSINSTEGKDVLFLMGGYGSDGITETYTGGQCTWTIQNSITNGPIDSTLAFATGHQILVLEEDNKRLRSFNTLTKKWNDLRPLPVFRWYMSAAVEGNELFVMGGSGHESRCDVYDIHLDSWTKTKSLNVCRLRSASCSLQGKVYCCGGQGNVQYKSSMEVFDPKEKIKGWIMTSSMSVGRDDHCLVSCGQYLWAVGGRDGTIHQKVLERFEPSTNSWKIMVSMPTERSRLTASFFGGQLYVIGGVNGEKLKTVDVYDPGENRWSRGASLNRSRLWHASCVVKEMPNAEDYQRTLGLNYLKKV